MLVILIFLVYKFLLCIFVYKGGREKKGKRLLLLSAFVSYSFIAAIFNLFSSLLCLNLVLMYVKKLIND